MFNKSYIPDIIKAWKSVKPEDVLGRLSYYNTLLFSTEWHNLDNDWYYFGMGKQVYWSPICISNPDRKPEEFFIDKPNIKNVVYYPKLASIVHKPTEKRSKYATYIYDNNPDVLELKGKDYAKFRAARNYMKDDDFTVEYFNAENHITVDVVFEVRKMIEAWKIHKKDVIKESVNYEPFTVISNLFDYGHLLDYVTTIIRYKGILIHYETSERINSNYIIISDLKPNVDLSQELSTRFGYVNRLAHWLHLTYWDSKYEGDRKYPIYFNIGTGGWDDAKKGFRPAHIVAEHNIRVGPKEKKEESSSTTLF